MTGRVGRVPESEQDRQGHDVQEASYEMVADEAVHVQRVAWDQDAVSGDWSGGCGSCGQVGCNGSCGSACGLPACCPPRWAHRTGMFGEYLYLRARDAEVVYAAIVDGPTTPPGNPTNPGNQVGPMALVDPDYESAFRVGFNRSCSGTSSFRGTFTRFESNTEHGTGIEPGGFVQSLVTHPGVDNAADNWLVGAARLDIDFALVDLDYRWLYAHCDNYAINLLAGARYARFEETFGSEFRFNGTRWLDTEIDFDGGGIRVGIEAERDVPAAVGWSMVAGSPVWLEANFGRTMTSGLRLPTRKSARGGRPVAS